MVQRHVHYQMPPRLRTGAAMLAVMALWFAMSDELPAAEPPERASTLVIGKVSDDPRKHYHRLKPMVDYAVERLADAGIEHGRVLLAQDNAQMIRLLREGRVDWVTETLFSAVRFTDAAPAEIVLLKRKMGAREYETVFITRAESGIRRLEDLGGQMLAVEDPGSTTAYFMPRMLLHRAGLGTRHLEPEDQTLADDEVGLAFAHDETNIALWVHKGRTAAGAYSNLDWDTPDHTPPVVRENMRIFHRSDAIPRAVELFRTGLSPEVKGQLRSILLEAHQGHEGRRALYAYHRTERFDSPDSTLRKGIGDIRDMLYTLDTLN